MSANLAGFRPPTIIVHNGEDADQIIKELEARGEIPPAADFPKGRIRVIVLRIVDPPKTDPGHGPVLQEAEQFSRENPNGLVIH